MTVAEPNHIGKVRDAIMDVLGKEFHPVKFVEVVVAETLDHDGDPVLDVTAIYEANDTVLDGSKLSAIVRHLRPVLSDSGEERFPMMSFVTRSDYDAFVSQED